MMGIAPNKQQTTSKPLKSMGSVLGGDEIDSECRTEDDDEHGGYEADKQSQ